mmetsp:Transcript_10784/g.13517  ORF Transcript_10784/g.13517 Transcript_10784/m.13517 type:complete len:184 (+) Transcript_10784:217-768(+)
MGNELSKVESLSLMGKKVSTLISGTGIMRRMNNLKELNLSNNRISIVATLSELKTLTMLNLSSNLIEEIANLNLPGLTHLILDHNQIRVIGGLRGLKKLEDLSLADNAIEDASVQETGFSLVNVTELNLAGNRITQLTKVFGYPQVKEMNLDRNPITSIDGVAFSACPELKNLSIDQIKLPNY